jgi:hypothetical protein
MLMRGHRPRRLISIFFLCAPLASAPAALADVPDSYVTTPGAAEAAVGKIVAEAGRPLRPLAIDIAPGRVGLTAQGADKDWHVEEWSIEPLDLWVVTMEPVSGPNAVEPGGPVADVGSGFFDLADIALGETHRIAAAAVERAALEDAAAVVSMRIERHVSILPEPDYGDVRWTIEVASPHESATVYADAKGAIIGADLSRTRRAKLLDLLAGDWPAADAQAQLQAVLGPREIVHEIWLYNSYISVEAEHPTDPKQVRGYAWDLSGVRRGIVDTPNMRMHFNDRMPFAFAEADLTILAELREEAKQRLQMPQGRVTAIFARKSTAGIGPPALEWRVKVTDAENAGPFAIDDAEGEVVADAKGAILKVVFPPGRQPPTDWLAPDGVRGMLDRLALEFGPGARLTEIVIDDRGAMVVAEDPRQPGTLARFIVDESKITRFGAPFDPSLSDGSAFTLDETAPLDPARIKAMMDETVRRMQLPDGRVFRVTLSRGNVFVQSSRNLITIEVRVDTPDQRSGGGRVTFEPDGTVIDIVAP